MVYPSYSRSMALPVTLTFEVQVTIARGDLLTECKFKVHIAVHAILSNFLFQLYVEHV